jgi:hypothetical protein
VCIKHYSPLLYAIATLSPYSQETEVLENQKVRETGEEKQMGVVPTPKLARILIPVREIANEFPVEPSAQARNGEHEDSGSEVERAVTDNGRHASNARNPVTDAGKAPVFICESFRLILDGRGVVLFELAVECGLADSE